MSPSEKAAIRRACAEAHRALEKLEKLLGPEGQPEEPSPRRKVVPTDLQRVKARRFLRTRGIIT